MPNCSSSCLAIPAIPPGKSSALLATSSTACFPVLLKVTASNVFPTPCETNGAVDNPTAPPANPAPTLIAVFSGPGISRFYVSLAAACDANKEPASIACSCAAL